MRAVICIDIHLYGSFPIYLTLIVFIDVFLVGG